MNLFKHFSYDELPSTFVNARLGQSWKPRHCLWLSCGDDWKKLSTKELGYPTPMYEYTFDIDLSRLVVLRTYDDLKRFSKKYGSKRIKIKDSDADHFLIDWRKVKNEGGYSGVYVKNARIKKARKEFLWYSMFDTCSIGIWKQDAIRKLYSKKEKGKPIIIFDEDTVDTGFCNLFRRRRTRRRSPVVARKTRTRRSRSRSRI